MITLRESAIKEIRTDKALFIKVQSALGISEKTMYDYISKSSQNLTKLSAIDALVSHTGKPLSELIEGGKVNKLLAK